MSFLQQTALGVCLMFVAASMLMIPGLCPSVPAYVKDAPHAACCLWESAGEPRFIPFRELHDYSNM
jgi:hypothetical protein